MHFFFEFIFKVSHEAVIKIIQGRPELNLI
jgi:hypothetical protein